MPAENTPIPNQNEVPPGGPAAPATPPAGNAPATPPAAPPAGNQPPANTDPFDLSPKAPAADPGPTDIAPTGDPLLDVTLDYFNRHGIKPDSEPMKRAAAGDFSLLEATIAVKGLKDADKFLALGKQAYEGAKARADAVVAKAREDIVKAVGSAEEWEAIRAWAAQHADEGERESISSVLRQGGMPAKAMAMYLKGLYQRAPDTTTNPARVTTEMARGKPVAEAPMTAAQYAMAVQELRSRNPNRAIEGTPEYRALQQRRLAAKSAGY